MRSSALGFAEKKVNLDWMKDPQRMKPFLYPAERTNLKQEFATKTKDLSTPRKIPPPALSAPPKSTLFQL
jgi:hypothetical protein